MKVSNIISKIDNILGLNEEDLVDKHKDYVESALRNEAESHSYEPNKREPRFKSLLHYTGSGYRSMNAQLRGIKPRPNVATDKHNSNLKELTKNSTNHSFIAYRGIPEKFFKGIKKDDVIEDKGFASTSLSKSTAQGFSVHHRKLGKLYRVLVNPGTKGYYASGHPKKNSRSEKEFILHPNTKFRVGDTHKDENGNEYTDLHIHSQED